MAKLDTPLLLSPVFKPKIWGKKDLAPLFAFPQLTRPGAAGPGGVNPRAGTEEPIGEAWITDDGSKFLNGPVAGFSLGETSRKYGPELNGAGWHDLRFPILAKYIFTSDWLSVQVHPDDDYACVHDPGNLGKCEMWYIVRADRTAEILLGLKGRTDRRLLRAAFEGGTSKDVLNRFRPKPGEAIFVPPGMVHALGPGLVLFEVEENSDLTYRLDDFGRKGLDGKPRPLHLDKGLEVTRPDLPLSRNLPRIILREPYGSRRLLVACPYFAVEELTVEKPGLLEGHKERVEAFSVFDGEGRIEVEAGWLGYRAGDTWLVPPATGRYRLMPRRKTRLLRFYVPDLDRDCLLPLARRRVALSKIKKLIFD